MASVHRRLFAVAAALTLAAPASVSAQWKPLHEDAAPPAFVAAPVLEPTAPSAIDRTDLDVAPAEYVAPALPGQTRTSRDVALMIVGGAALILGSVIGDDAGAMMMVGGGVVGLVGLYQYLT